MKKEILGQSVSDYINEKFKDRVVARWGQILFDYSELVDTVRGFAELLNKNIEMLEKENAELRNNGFTVSAMTEQQLKVAIEKGEQLEKENVELKETVVRMNKVITETFSKLTKAKEIIKNIIRVTWGEGWSYTLGVKVEAEQFLKE